MRVSGFSKHQSLKVLHLRKEGSLVMRRRPLIQGIILVAMPSMLLCFPANLPAYSVLSHQTLIDAAWETGILPLLRQRFSGAGQEQLLQAHSYAYGGSLIQDLGYFPRGSHEYSDLLHYVRSGDFIVALIRDAHDINEYAFALGALSHFSADNEGHRLAVNLAVPILYSHLREKHGNAVTYEDDPLAHVKTEFGFDVLEVAKQRFAPESYRSFIGFRIAKELLARAFEETYSIPLDSKFPTIDRTINSFRYNVRSLIPEATKVAWALKKNEIKKDLPGVTREKFLYNLSQASYEKEWGKDYHRPGVGSRILAFFFRLVPKVGPLRLLALRMPTPETERMFEASFNAAVTDYLRLLRDLRRGELNLPNRNLDTGGVSAPGTYFMLDGAYAHLLHQLVSQPSKRISPELRSDLLAHFASQHLSRIKSDKFDKTKVDWSQVPQELQTLKDLR